MRRNLIESGLSLIGGAGLGAAMMYLFDPETGPDRRERIRTVAGDTLHHAGDALHTTWDTVADSAYGVGHSIRDTAGQWAHPTDGPERLHHAASSARERSGSMLSSMRDRASEWLDSARGAASTAGESVSDTASAFGSAGLLGSVSKAISHGTDAIGRRARHLRDRASEARDYARHSAASTLGISEERHTASGQALGAVGVLALGAAMFYFLDPRSGRRRRTLAGQKAASMLNETSCALQQTGRYMRGHLRGIAAETRARFSQENVSDQQLCERVRSQIGHYTTHARGVDVSAREGCVTLGGCVLDTEHGKVLAAVKSVRGVKHVDDQLERGASAQEVESSANRWRQAAMRRLRDSRSDWGATQRLALGVIGGTVGFYGAVRRDVLGGAMGLIGLGLIARSASNVSTRKLMGMATNSRPIRVHKSIHIEAPVERIYNFWRNYENFPKFMSNVHEVTETGEGRSHWVVAGPAGSKVAWDAEVTQQVPNETLAWQSLPGSTVDNAGAVRFIPENDGTRVDITLWYTPPAGALGHVVAKLFGADPRSEMDQDLANVKQELESLARTM